MTTDRASYPRRRDVRDAARPEEMPPSVVTLHEATSAATGRVGSSAASSPRTWSAGPTGPRAAVVPRPVMPVTPAPAPPAPPAPAPPASGRVRASAPDDLALIPDGDDGRGRHATGRGDGFGRLVGLTVLGAALPGAGLIAAGRRRTGWAVLVPFLFALGALGAVVASGRAVALARQEVFRADAMLYLAVACAVVAVVWCLVILASHLALRREVLTRPQRFLSMLLVAALMALVVIPTATGARYALVDRSLLLSVFGATGSDRSGLANPDTGSANPWAGTPRVNVLLVGADSSQGHEGTRPDTVMVASINTRTGDTVLLGLPRQLANVPFAAGSPAAKAWPTACRANGQGGCILNAAYLFGVQNPQYFPHASDPGLEATRAAAAGITGLQIDYEAMINLDGFEDLVNAMGGITMTVNHAYPIGGGHILGSHGQETGRSYPITGHLPVGKDEHLNGYQAEWYVRSRADSDNNDRMNRQRCFVNAAVHQYSVVALAKAFPALAASAEKDFATDISAKQLNAFVDLGLKVKSGSLRTLAFDSPEGTDTSDPDYATIHAQVQTALNPVTPTPAPSASASTSTPSAPAPAASTPAGQAVDADSVCAS